MRKQTKRTLSNKTLIATGIIIATLGTYNVFKSSERYLKYQPKMEFPGIRYATELFFSSAVSAYGLYLTHKNKKQRIRF